jgi:hypothetical protein
MSALLGVQHVYASATGQPLFGQGDPVSLRGTAGTRTCWRSSRTDDEKREGVEVKVACFSSIA